MHIIINILTRLFEVTSTSSISGLDSTKLSLSKCTKYNDFFIYVQRDKLDLIEMTYLLCIHIVQLAIQQRQIVRRSVIAAREVIPVIWTDWKHCYNAVALCKYFYNELS